MLKGIPQVSFQLRIEETDLLYEWQVRPFINESSYRGVMLVGQDVTDKESLNWQLMQLSPESGYMQEKIESQSLLSEMSYLSALSAESNLVDLQGWIRLILSIFDDLNDGSEESRNVALGEVMSSEYVKIAQELTSTKQIFELGCATELGLQKVSCGLSLEILIRLLIMLSMTHEGRSKLKVGPLQQGVEFILDGVSLESRPLMEWVLNRLLERLDGEQRISREGGLSICLPLLTQKSQITTFSEDMTVAVVGRHKDYAFSLCELLKGLGVTVSCYQDEEDFFAQSKKTNRFNAVFAVSCQNNGLVLKLTRSIKDQYDSQQMPLIWLTCYNDLVRDPSVYLMQNGLSEFHVYQALEYASQRKPIAPLSFHYQGVAWILVGGSRVQKAVLKTHLTHCSLASQSYDDLSDYEGVFSYYTKAVVVLLDEQDDSVLSDIKRRFPDIVLVSLQERHSFSPSLVTTFELNYPYSLDEVKELADHINQYITEN